MVKYYIIIIMVFFTRWQNVNIHACSDQCKGADTVSGCVMYIKIVDLETVGQLVCQLPQFLWKWKKKYLIE